MAAKYFKVEAKLSTYCFIHVKANSAEEAREIAEGIDGGDFISEENSGTWEIVNAEKIKKAEATNLHS